MDTYDKNGDRTRGKRMTIIHLLYAGGTGGIEKLCIDIAKKSNTHRNVFVFVHEGGMMCNEMKNLGKEIVELNCKNWEIVKFSKILRELILKYQASYIVIHHPSPLIWISALSPLINIKILVYAHNTYTEIIKKKYWKKLIYNRLLKKSNGIIAISKYVKTTFEKDGDIRSDKIHIIYNGVDISEKKL